MGGTPVQEDGEPSGVRFWYVLGSQIFIVHCFLGGTSPVLGKKPSLQQNCQYNVGFATFFDIWRHEDIHV